MTDRTLDDIMSEREPASVEQAPIVSDADRAANPIGTAKAERDQAGRFAPKDPSKQTEPQAEGDVPEADQRQTGTVPKQALEAERRKRQERDDELAQMRQRMADMERRFSAPQATPAPVEPPKAPQFWEDPDAAADYRVRQALDPMREEFTAYKLSMSRQLAAQQHGDEAVNGAIQGVMALRQSNPAEFQRLEALAERSVDPVGELVRWHKQQRTVQEVGEDPEAYFQRRLAEWQAAQDQNGAVAPQQQQPAPRAPLPTSFAGQRSGAPRGGPAYSGPRALSEIMGK